MFKSVAAGFLDPAFNPINVNQLQTFAARFNVSEELTSLLALLEIDTKPA